MADDAPHHDVASAPAETASTTPDVVGLEVKGPVLNGTTVTEPSQPSEEVATKPDATAVPPLEPQVPESEPISTTNDKPASATPPSDKPATTQEDIEMKDSLKPEDVAPVADTSIDPAVDDSVSADKSKARRKSGAIPEHKKKLNKKQSKAKMTHTDAQPGDYFFVRLKGYPLWPAIVCDETMLPSTLLKSRPVTAARPDGTYRADYEDGGNKVKDRTFPVMYLHTNEFGWIPNFDLLDLDFEKVGEVSSNMRKDLHAAHLLAAEKHDLDYFKEILKNFMEARAADLEAKEAAKAAKKASKLKRKSKVVGEDDDVEMEDAPHEADSEEADAEVVGSEKPKKSKKRKVPADVDAATPQRDDSVKKPKTTIKLTTTPKTTNGTATPQTAKDSSKKTSKPKTKKDTPKVKEMEAAVPKEPEPTPEEKRQKKEKEILFLRHKLQKGLLTRDQEPKEEEMKSMSEFVSKLEGYADLEVAIIRATKINKVLKAILKLSSIPKEEEFQFKPRSQTLLDKWNKLLATEQGTPAAASAPSSGPPTAPTSAETTNGTSEDVKPELVEPTVTTATHSEVANGLKEPLSEVKVEEKAPVVTEDSPKAEARKVEVAPAPVEQPAKEMIAESTPVESTA